MTKHYTELTGRRVQFGAPVYEGCEYFCDAPPQVRIGGKRFPLRSIGVTGFSVDVSAETLPAMVESASFEQDGEVLSEIRVLRVDSGEGGGVAEFRPIDRTIDPEQIAVRNATVIAKRGAELSGGNVDPAYRVLCADVRNYLGAQRRMIDSKIAPFAARFSAADLSEVMQGLELSGRSAWLELSERANEILLPLNGDREAARPFKEYTENVVTPELLGGESWRRSYLKPMGYPGDFMIMNYMYDHQPVGDTTYEKYLHLLGLVSGELIVNRMNYVSALLDRLAEEDSKRSHFHVMSIGSGPAREIQKFVERNGGRGRGYSFTLLDPEENALEYAINAAYRAADPSNSNLIVSGLNVSFTEMLRPGVTLRHLPQQDLIYSSGLVDYLNPSLSAKLVGKLYERLLPGGSVVIANVNDAADGAYWSLEYVCDWTLYFRTREDMVAMAAQADGAIVDVKEGGGGVYILTVTKPLPQ